MTKGILGQPKDGESFSNREMEVQKDSEEMIFVNSPTCVVGKVEGNSCSEHDDLAKLVVDVEHSNVLCIPKIVLGQQGKKSAQWEVSQDPMPAHREVGVGGFLHECEKVTCDALLRNHIEGLVLQELEEGSKVIERLRETEDEVVVRGTMNKSSPRRSKKKGLWELRGPSTHPRRSMRISERSSRARNSPSCTFETPVATISYGDIFNCNARLCESEGVEEPTMLWEVGKHMGIAC